MLPATSGGRWQLVPEVLGLVENLRLPVGRGGEGPEPRLPRGSAGLSLAARPAQPRSRLPSFLTLGCGCRSGLVGSLGSVTADTGRPQPALGSGVCTRIQPETGGAQELLVPGGSSVGAWGWQGLHPEGVWVTLWSLCCGRGGCCSLRSAEEGPDDGRARWPRSPRVCGAFVGLLGWAWPGGGARPA